MDHLAYGCLLACVDDSRVFHPRGMQPEEIRILCEQNAPFSACERQMLLVASAQDAGFRHCKHVNAARSQTPYDRFRYVLVGVKSLIRSVTQLSCRELPAPY